MPNVLKIFILYTIDITINTNIPNVEYCSTDVIPFSIYWYLFMTSAPFYKHGLTLILAWISNYMPRKVQDEITYPFLNFNGCTVEV